MSNGKIGMFLERKSTITLVSLGVISTFLLAVTSQLGTILDSLEVFGLVIPQNIVNMIHLVLLILLFMSFVAFLIVGIAYIVLKVKKFFDKRYVRKSYVSNYLTYQKDMAIDYNIDLSKLSDLYDRWLEMLNIAFKYGDEDIPEEIFEMSISQICSGTKYFLRNIFLGIQQVCEQELSIDDRHLVDISLKIFREKPNFEDGVPAIHTVFVDKKNFIKGSFNNKPETLIREISEDLINDQCQQSYKCKSSKDMDRIVIPIVDIYTSSRSYAYYGFLYITARNKHIKFDEMLEKLLIYNSIYISYYFSQFYGRIITLYSLDVEVEELPLEEDESLENRAYDISEKYTYEDIYENFRRGRARWQ